jgi:hypothetical protein
VFRGDQKPKLSQTGKLSLVAFVEVCSRGKPPAPLAWYVNSWQKYGRAFEKMITATLAEWDSY